MSKKDYLSVIYNELDKPLTEYPAKLTKFLFDNYILLKNKKILDLGCGRGEFLNGFLNQGLDVYGVDRSTVGMKYCKDELIKIVDLEKDVLPFNDNFFDVIFSKSVIEHFYYPEKIITEAYRVLKPGGTIITMCPSWEYMYRDYFEDYTHRTPFMKSSLRDLHIINGFEKVKVEYFRQLPIIWKYPFLSVFSELIRIFCPEYFKSKNKFIRFSKEIMLICVAKKPKV